MMKKYTREILLTGATLTQTGSTDLYVTVFLDSSVDVMGIYSPLIPSNVSLSGITVELIAESPLPPVIPTIEVLPYVVTGFCESRLEEVRAYGGNFLPGVVTQPDGTIHYTIDGITYQTNPHSGVTFFRYNGLYERITPTGQILMMGEHLFGYSDAPNIDSDIVMERPESSVFENQYRMKTLRSLRDFETYGGGFYKIY
jgi:hypothetical protein